MHVIYDDRWIGLHGIGRFATEIGKRCSFMPMGARGKPLDLFDSWHLRQELLSRSPVHFFSPGFNAPLGKPCHFSFTVHDLIHLEVEAERSLTKTLYYELVIRPAISNAEIIFTVSEYSRARIVDWASVSPDKVICVGNGVDAAFSPKGGCWHHPRPYLLYVGNQKPHKNVEGLIEAFALSDLRDDFDILLTGSISDSVAQIIAAHSLENQIKGLGVVPEVYLPSLYRTAHAVVMPSRYEGFGLPLIEAMASGTPVLSSNKTSLPEVGANAVAYFDPDDSASFVNGLNALVDDGICDRLRLAGLERAKQFSWDQVVARIDVAITNLVG